MKIELDGTDVLKSIAEELSAIQFQTVEEEKKAMRSIGNVIKAEVKKLLPVSDVNRPADEPHMRDDIKVNVSTKDGVTSCIVSGGKKTAYKWHMLDDGTRNRDGSVHTEAMHFTGQALRNAESGIDKILKEVERGVHHD